MTVPGTSCPNTHRVRMISRSINASRPIGVVCTVGPVGGKPRGVRGGFCCVVGRVRMRMIPCSARTS